MQTTLILGAPDPEMTEIEVVAREEGIPVLYAAVADARTGKIVRVAPFNASKATHLITKEGREVAIPDGEIVSIECSVSGIETETRIDHHNPGDSGFGVPPQYYMRGSSLGQFLMPLDREPTQRQRYIAAADHCLGAAYAGACPGIDPDVLRRFRIRERAQWLSSDAPPARAIVADLRRLFPGENLEEMLNTAIDSAVEIIKNAPKVAFERVLVADLRNHAPIPELPEATVQSGVPVLYRMDPPPGAARGTRVKIGLMGAGEGALAGVKPAVHFLNTFAREVGLVDTYGDPVRGIVGGYLP